jgi:hypothetical protein
MCVSSRATSLIGLLFGIEFEFLFEKEAQVGMVQISVRKGAREVVEPFTGMENDRADNLIGLHIETQIDAVISIYEDIARGLRMIGVDELVRQHPRRYLFEIE